jgi:hypothetical protein
MFDSVAFLAVNRNGEVYVFYYDEMNEMKMLTHRIVDAFGDIYCASSYVHSDGCRLVISNRSRLDVVHFKLDLFEKGNAVLPVLSDLSFDSINLEGTLTIRDVLLVDDSRAIFVSESDLIGFQIHSLQKQSTGWLTTAKVNTKAVSAICSYGGNRNMVVVGYEDGTLDYRALSNLQTISFWDSMFADMLQDINEPSDMGMIEDLDSIFDNSKGASRIHANDIPIILRPSPNQTHIMRFAVCPDNSNRCVIRLEEICKPTIPGKAQEKLFARISEMIIMGHRNGNDMEDLGWFLRDLFSSNSAQLQRLSKALIQLCKSISGHRSLSECLFDNSNCMYVVGEVVVYHFFVLNAVNPQTHMCENIFYILQFGLIKDIISRALLNPHESMATMESALYNYASAEPFLKFHIGSTHHMAAFIMWVLDFSGYLLRYLYLYFNHRPEQVVGTFKVM